jgi:hypothetical protein
MAETLEEIFNEIENAFSKNFNECRLTNRTTNLEIEFSNEYDYNWFEENICYPKNLDEKEYPIDFLSSLKPIGDILSDRYGYSFIFTVKDKDKLIEMLNQR